MYNTTWDEENYPAEVEVNQDGWTSTQLAVRWLYSW